MPDIAYTVHGRRARDAPVLLTHGFGASQAMWAPNVDALGVDRQVLTWDLPGHGASVASRRALARALHRGHARAARHARRARAR